MPGFPGKLSTYSFIRAPYRKAERIAYLALQLAKGNYSLARIDIDWPDTRERYHLINALIERNQYSSYLEIGCRNDYCFAKVNIALKVGVDPEHGGTLRLTSDAFFAQNTERFDIVFVDGLHTYEQVRTDVLNALACINEGGVIVMHDCLPSNATAQLDKPLVNQWNGDVWKAFVEVRTWPGVEAATCLIDQGMGLIVKRPNTAPLPLKGPFKDLKYAQLQKNFRSWMRLINFDEAVNFANRPTLHTAPSAENSAANSAATPF